MGRRSDSDENYVIGPCEEILGQPAQRQHSFDWLRGDPAPPRYPHGRTLPVDGYWPDLKLVVEFHERQHTEPVAFFDKPDRLTISGVPRGEQRRLYDARRVELIPRHGLRLVIIPKSAFTVRRGYIVRQPADDSTVARSFLKPQATG